MQLHWKNLPSKKQRCDTKQSKRLLNDIKRLKGQARDKYRNLSEEEKNEKREYGNNRYHNISRENKQKLREYKKKIP